MSDFAGVMVAGTLIGLTLGSIAHEVSSVPKALEHNAAKSGVVNCENASSGILGVRVVGEGAQAVAIMRSGFDVTDVSIRSRTNGEMRSDSVKDDAAHFEVGGWLWSDGFDYTTSGDPIALAPPNGTGSTRFNAFDVSAVVNGQSVTTSCSFMVSRTADGRLEALTSEPGRDLGR